MTTKLEEIAKKAQQERKFRFTSLANHVSKDLVWESLCHMDLNTAPGIDGMTVKEAKDTFQIWVDPTIQSMHSRGYKPPAVKRCWIPKPGKQEKRPIGIPTFAPYCTFFQRV